MFAFATVLSAAEDRSRGRTANPHGNLAIRCENCHSTSTWRPIRAVPEFDHGTQTAFPLKGLHQRVACTSCHRSLVFRSTGNRCADCHADVHRRQMGANCESCHTVMGWRAEVPLVQRHQNRFPLVGAHAAVACDACHRNGASGNFSGLSTECVTCHQLDYQRTSRINHRAANFPTNCEACHGVDRWQGARFDHQAVTGYPLQGAHARIECSGCHAGGRFQVSTVCSECHSREFAAARNPDHVQAGFPRDCTACHTMVSWSGAKFDHAAQARFPLTGAHGVASCVQCHLAGKFSGTARDCNGCHLVDFERAANPDHKRGRFSTSCETCHNTSTWQGASFDHNLSRFPLTGAHAAASCAQCHANGRYTGTPAECFNCHRPAFEATRNPNHAAAGFPQDCAVCHTSVRWEGAAFDHNARTRFQLTGAHTGVACSQCHAGNRFAGTPQQCAGCHLADFQKTTNPNHAAAGFSQDCTICHTVTQWKGASFDHSRTRFPLTGAHAGAECARCHVNGQYTGLSSQCVSCHLTDFQKTTNPSHAAAGFPQDCAVCHTSARWQGATFDHSRTRFQLTGAHTNVGCSQCHTGNRFAGTPQQCAGCHLAVYQKTANPNHAAAGFPQDCAVCHTTARWQGATFDHSRTRFPLTGAHAGASCTSCHVNNQYSGLSSQCVSCHLADFQKTTNPSHAAAGFPQDCAACHTSAHWQGATFDHNARTRFQLTGAHTSVGCSQCHAGNRFAGTPQQCAGCHLADYQKTTNPNHATAGFPQDCAICHTSARWQGATFDHSRARFQLTGAHTSVSCTRCHVNNVFAGTPKDCAGCHMADYGKTTNPNHGAAGFPQDCSLCHSTTQWRGAVFNHSATRFPLTGAHTKEPCSACHINNVYRGTSLTCDGCHLKNYDATTNPSHTGAGFPKDCSICHSTTQWRGARFDHNTMTKFALTGAHTRVACANCHVGNRFAGTPADCFSCHSKEYETVTNPNHISAGFPRTCGSCHSTAQWTGAQFSHSFPIYNGSHSGKWRTCGDCHTNASNYSVFSCTNCHEHEQTRMNQKHKEVRNYVYNSLNCYSCHPQGKH